MRPTPYEMASRLSYLFLGLGARPAAARRRTGRQAPHARRTSWPRRRGWWRTRCAKDVVRFFHGQLFGIRGLDALVRDVNFYPTFKPGMGALMRQETERFIDHVVWDGTGTFNELMTAPYTFVNGRWRASTACRPSPATRSSR